MEFNILILQSLNQMIFVEYVFDTLMIGFE